MSGNRMMSGGRLFRDSIRGRAALLTSLLVTVALAAFTWFTVARVQADLIRRGFERAEGAATTLAAQTQQSTQQGLTRVNQFANGPAVTALLRSPSEETRQAVLATLNSIGTPTQDQTIEVWDAQGQRILEAALPPEAATLIPYETTPPVAPGLLPLRTNGDVLYTRTISEVLRDAGHPSEGRLGYFVQSRVVRASATPALLNGVVGNGAIVLVGNESGSVWTDLGRIVRPPVIDLSMPGGREFIGSNGDRQIGAPVKIAGTPFVIVVAFPRNVILAPARQLLIWLSAASVFIIVIATVAARALSSRVTEPLAELTRAAQAIEQGDYSRRVAAPGRDEVGQLAHAFNAMAEQVESGRRALQAHASELSVSREAARQANESKDEFLAVLSHELRTPLNAILGWCHILGAGVTPPGGTAHAIKVIERNANAQLRLVEDLLDISRIVSGRFVLDKELVDPGAVVDAAVESIQPALIAKEISLTIDRAPGMAGTYVHGDAGRLQQAVWNLLSNAIKFTPKFGDVRIEIRPVSPGLEIAVRDTGEGISAAALPIIFDRLQQGDNGAARRHGGLGLGLAIVRQIVELHQGSVSAESEGIGRGATFRIHLPTITRHGVPGGAPPQPPILALPVRVDQHSSVRGLQILVVEDSDDARELMLKLLSAEGAIVTTCESAQSAMEWLRAHQPDLIVSDIGMPERDGWQMMQAIRSRGLAMAPAIALTAHATPEDRDRSIACGFQEHLTKPVDFAELLQAIARLAGRPMAAGDARGV